METVESATRPLLVDQQQLEFVCELLNHEFQRGLQKETNRIANVKMYPTYVKDRPIHHDKLGHFAEPEEGKFLALDLGGTNFRVILVELEGSQFHMDNEKYSLSRELMHGPGYLLFDYIAECLNQFVQRRSLKTFRLPLGFTFSFPCQQESLTHARLVNWTKGFKCSGVEGRDVVELLREAIDRRPDLDIEVMAVVNDTTGTLISCAYQNRECRVGLIVGTGTNACYMEQVDNVHCMNEEDNFYLDDESSTNSSSDDASDSSSSLSAGLRNSSIDDDFHRKQTTIVNTEWGAFGDNGILDFIITKWDNEIDANSVNVGKQKFEKMISGLYIGELCRRIIYDMVSRNLLFVSSDNTTTNEKLQTNRDLKTTTTSTATIKEKLLNGKIGEQFSFDSRLVSEVEMDAHRVYQKTRATLKEAFDIDWATDEDCENVKTICTRVSTRAAHLVSAAVATLLNRMRRPHTVVGVDGSMFRFHPHFHSLMNKKTKELTRPEYSFQLMFSEDGSGKGAAIVASVACKQRRISRELIQQREVRRQQSLVFQ